MDGQSIYSLNTITPSKDETGVYYVQGQTWQVGARYTLVKVLGTGSFSCVCLAVDKETQEQVALKRIGDVLSSTENAKRVLREVCILRRLEHPHIIALRDAFVRPAATGRYVYRRGRLTPTSIDLYLATEYCDRGDLFSLRGQLAEGEARSIMWQLLCAVRYLHANGVWHRDIKSANVLLTVRDGARAIKLADLGSARSAASAAGEAASAARASKQAAAAARGGGARRQHALSSSPAAAALSSSPSAAAMAAIRSRDSFCALTHDAPTRAAELYALQRPGSTNSVGGGGVNGGGGGGYRSPLTRVVCTPCYRAPEVIMSRGEYSGGIDSWSVGCVFGELLGRVAYIGNATTPQLQVAPVFAIQGLPETPDEGEHFEGGPGNPVTRQELEALFAVIGTPAWACIDAVRGAAWRAYLRKVPGRAPTLFRRFGAAGEPAVDLLSRLLTFDPARRCGAEEALAHEYFGPARAAVFVPDDDDVADAVAADAGGGAEQQEEDEAMAMDDEEEAEEGDAMDAGGGGDQQARAAAAGSASARAPPVLPPPPVPPPQQQHYYDVRDPAAALAKLELELAEIVEPAATAAAATAAGCARGSGAACENTDARDAKLREAATERLRELLEREVDDLHAAVEYRRRRRAEGGAAGTSVGSSGMMMGASPPTWTPSAAVLAANAAAMRSPPPAPSTASWGFALPPPPPPPPPADPRLAPPRPPLAPPARRWEHARPDPAAAGAEAEDAARVAHDRLPFVADTGAAHLEAEKHLRAGRHTEWTAEVGERGPKAGPAWGVSLLPPGLEEAEHPELVDIIRSQHRR